MNFEESLRAQGFDVIVDTRAAGRRRITETNTTLEVVETGTFAELVVEASKSEYPPVALISNRGRIVLLSDAPTGKIVAFRGQDPEPGYFLALTVVSDHYKAPGSRYLGDPTPESLEIFEEGERQKDDFIKSGKKPPKPYKEGEPVFDPAVDDVAEEKPVRKKAAKKADQ